jgi:ribonuclease HI
MTRPRLLTDGTAIAMTAFSKTPPPASARLFADAPPHTSGPPAGVHLANIDGASRGNPGPAAYAVVIRDPEGRVVLELAKKIGRETNNVAEYYALLAALDYAGSQGVNALRIRSDSELLVRQMQGRYQVKSTDLKPLYERASRMSRQLRYFTIEHVRREQNRDADALANEALDSGEVFRADSKLAATPPQDLPDLQPAEPRASGSKNTPAEEDSRSVTFRARVERGALVPLEPLDLPEGTLAEVSLRIPEQE